MAKAKKDVRTPLCELLAAKKAGDIPGSVPIMACIEDVADCFKLPTHFVRAAVNNGTVVAVRSGRKIFVNVDKFVEWLGTSTLTPTERDHPINKCSATDDNPRGFARIEL